MRTGRKSRKRLQAEKEKEQLQLQLRAASAFRMTRRRRIALAPLKLDRLAKWQLPGAPPVTDEEAEDCLKCLRDYAARMSRDELGQLSGEALRQYIENLNREKNRRKE